MNQEISPVMLEHYLIRAVMSLSSAAAKTDLDDVRDDLRDAAALLIRLAIAGPASLAVQDWCDRTLSLLDSLGDLDGQTVSSARLAILRLRSTLLTSFPEKEKSHTSPAGLSEVKAPRPRLGALGNNSKKILEFVKDNPDVRTRELVAHFLPALSARTIKRCLKELVDGGALERLQHEGAVLYRMRSGQHS